MSATCPREVLAQLQARHHLLCRPTDLFHQLILAGPGSQLRKQRCDRICEHGRALSDLLGMGDKSCSHAASLGREQMSQGRSAQKSGKRS